MKGLIALVLLVTDSKKEPTSTNPFQPWVMWSQPWLTCPWVKRKCWCHIETLFWPNCFRMLWVATVKPSWLLLCLQLISTMMKHWVLWGMFSKLYIKNFYDIVGKVEYKQMNKLTKDWIEETWMNRPKSLWQKRVDGQNPDLEKPKNYHIYHYISFQTIWLNTNMSK